MEQKKRMINIRFCFSMFVGIMSGILSYTFFAYLIYLNSFKTLPFIMFLLSLVNLASLFFVIFYKKKDFKKYLKHIIAFLSCFAIGMSVFVIKISVVSAYPTFEGKVDVTGTICSYGQQESYYKLVLDKVTVGDKKLKSKMVVAIYLDKSVPETISLGDSVSFTARVKKTEFVSQTKINFDTYSYGSVYSSSASMSQISHYDKKPNFIYAVQDKVRNLLDENLNPENSAFAYSALLGDKSRITDNIKDTFSYAGISHIVAVSGLHVSFFSAILYFVIGLFKGGRKTRFFVTAPILLLYCTLCGFSSSVLRATFMSIIFMLADLLGEQYDSLNSLSFAGFLILLLLPFNLFNLGFQLSFMCVFIIITLANRMTRILQFHLKMPKWIASSFSISFCVTIGTLALCANSLGDVSLISVFSNLLVIPLFSVAYPLLTISLFFTLIIPQLSFVFAVPELFLHAIKIVANFFAELSISHFKFFNLGYLIVFFFVVLCLVGRFFMLPIKHKSIIMIVLSVCCSVLFCFGIAPKTYRSNLMISNYQYDSNSVIFTTTENKKVLVDYDDYSTDQLLRDAKINSIDTWILYDIEINNLDFYEQFIREYKVDKIMLPHYNSLTSYDIIRLSKLTDISIADVTTMDDISVIFIANEEVCAGVKLCINNKSILISNGTTVAKLGLISAMNTECVDYFVINSSKHDIPYRFGIRYNTLIYHNDVQYDIIDDSICMENKDFYAIKL